MKYSQYVRPVRFAAVLVTVLLIPCVSLAQGEGDAPPVPQSLFGEVIDVRVVNLEVVVSAKGERVSGLLPEDFVLEVDGREVPIEYFTEVLDGVAANAPGPESSMVPSLAAGEPVGTSYLLFIDEMLSVEVRRNLVLRRMIEQLSHLGPADRMAVMAYNGRRLDVLSSWNDSSEALEQVLLGAMQRPAYGMHERGRERSALATATSSPEPVPQSPSFDFVSTIGEGDGEADGGGGDGAFEGFTQERTFGAASSTGLTLAQEDTARWFMERLVRVVSAATASLRSFAQPPGRKVMLIMSGGWPDNPTEWLNREATTYQLGRSRERDVIYGPLIDTANLLSYTLYPIDVPGNNSPPDDVVIKRATLRRLAAETGGKPMLAGDGLAALEKTVADTRSYYWIGFTPKWKGNDEQRKIDVKVNRRGLKARTRQGFSDLSRQREVSMMVESAMRVGEGVASISFPARVGADVRKAGAGKVDVALQMLIPVHELTFVPHQGRYVAEVELRVAVEDEYGTTTDVPVVPVLIELDELPEGEKMQRWETRIKIRRQKHDVIVSFFDALSGKLLTSRLEVDPNSI